MDKAQIIDKVKTVSTPSIDKTLLLGWLGSMPSTSLTRKPNVYRVGDVLMHPIFKHPYILLENKKGHWICGLITSEETCTEIIEVCQSRFFADNHFTRVIFTVNEPVGAFMSAFDNTKQVKKILNILKTIFK